MFNSWVMYIDSNSIKRDFKGNTVTVYTDFSNNPLCFEDCQNRIVKSLETYYFGCDGKTTIIKGIIEWFPYNLTTCEGGADVTIPNDAALMLLAPFTCLAVIDPNLIFDGQIFPMYPTN